MISLGGSSNYRFTRMLKKIFPTPSSLFKFFIQRAALTSYRPIFRDLLLIRAIPRSFGIGDRVGLEICWQSNFQICSRLQLASDHSPRRGAKRIVIIRSVSVEMTLRRWPWKIIKATYARHMFPNGTRAD